MNGWIENKRTKVKITGKIGGGFKIYTKKLFSSTILFGL
jgi:hypothetical protein